MSDATALKMLVVHNAYRQRAGEDAVVDAEVALLREQGHEVVEYRRDNDELAGMPVAAAAIETVWSSRTVRDVRALIESERPQLVHVHNTFLRISPALYWAVARHQLPVVQTVHNFRLACPQGMFQRQGRACEDCLGHVPWRAVWHGCYRGSRAQSAVVATMLQTHRALATWQRHVARWIALSDWSRGKLVQAGVPAERLEVLPNFAPAVAPNAGARRGLLFVGRLALEKGVVVLSEALRRTPGLTIDVIGDGPDAPVFDGLPNVRRQGHLNPPQVQAAMCAAAALVLPSVGHENSPRVLVEALACGLPVIASRQGALAESVQHGHDGWLVPPGDARALAEAMQQVLADPAEAARRGANARARHAALHTPALHHAALLRIYRSAMAEATSSPPLPGGRPRWG